MFGRVFLIRWHFGNSAKYFGIKTKVYLGSWSHIQKVNPDAGIWPINLAMARKLHIPF
jgi:hypothetical protein